MTYRKRPEQISTFGAKASLLAWSLHFRCHNMPVMGGKAKDHVATARLTGGSILPDAVAFARNFADSACLPQKMAIRLAVIVEELVTNLCEHGGLSEGDKVTLSLALNGDVLTLQMEDPCPAFDLREHEFQGPEGERGGGVGLELIRQWAHSLDYRSEQGINFLKLELRL